jgi:hypothetical protein
MLRGQRDESLRPYSRIYTPELLLFLPSSSSVVLTRLSGPRSRPTTFFYPCSSRESNPGEHDRYLVEKLRGVAVLSPIVFAIVPLIYRKLLDFVLSYEHVQY